MNHRLSLATLLIASAFASVTAFAQTTPAEPTIKHSGHTGGHQGRRHDPEKMRAMIDERFKKADTNNDGFLSKEEAEKGLPRVARRFADIDADKDGKVSRQEIDGAMKQAGQHRGKHAEARFKKADKNGDGLLSKDEVANASPLVRDFDKIDTNKDGKLSKEELRAYGEERRKARGAAQPK